jgi:hypothetical protein
MRQIARLGSGRVLYKAIDLRGRGDNVSNCIHAVSDIDTDRGLLVTGASYGIDPSAAVAEHLAPWVIDRDGDYLWINEKLGVKDVVRQ